MGLSPRLWQSALLVAAGAAAGAFLFACLSHPGQAPATAGSGNIKMGQIPATKEIAAPESIELDGTRIPPPPAAIQPSPSESGDQHMEFAKNAAEATPSKGFDARTVVVDGRQLEYSTTASGYAINVGRRAVDSNDPEQSASNPLGANVTEDPGGWRSDDVSSGQYVGRKGLIENPCVDPPSTHGASYSKGY